MNKIKLIAIAISLGLGTAFAQEVEKKMEFKLVVDSGEGPEVVSWTTEGEDFSGLAIGETRTISVEGGKEILVTRTDAGMEFKVNGETVVVPDMGGHGTHMAFVSADGGHTMDSDIDVEVMALGDGDETVDVRIVGAGAHALPIHEATDGVTIISAEPLDESVRESIRSVLISAGNDDEIRFIDGSGDGPHVRVIKKRIEIRQ